MINEKISKYISLISMALVIIFIFVSIFFVNFKIGTEAISSSVGENIEEVLDKNVITDINIEIKESDWEWLKENALDEEYRSADVTINGETFHNVGVRPKGNSSLTSVYKDPTTDRYSLKLDFGEFIDGQTYHGVRQLALNNNIFDSTYMKEALSYDLYESLGIATPEYSFSNIKINGEEWGLYLAVEAIDERFVEKNYGTDEGNLYKPESSKNDANNKEGNKGQNPPMEPNNQVNKEGIDFNKVNPNKEDSKNTKPNMELDKEGITNKENDENNKAGNENMKGGMPGGMGGSTQGADLKYIDDNIDSYTDITKNAVFKKSTDEDFEKIVDMIRSLETGENIERYINVDEVLKYFAVNTFLVNLDSYSGRMYHNYYLYENNGICEMLPWDLNMSFGGFSMNDGSKVVNFPIDSPVLGDLEDFQLINKLLENTIYKEKYHEYLSEIAENYFESGMFLNTVNKYDALISSYVKTDPTAFYTYDEYKNGVKELIVFGEDRTKSVEAQLSGEQTSTEYGAFKTNLNMQALGGQNKGGENRGDKNQEGNVENNKNNPNMLEAIPRESMEEAMKILNGREYSSLSEEEKSKLNEIGVTEESLNAIQNIIPKEMGNKPPSQEGESTSNKIYFVLLGVCLASLLISNLFISKYKRKRY